MQGKLPFVDDLTGQFVQYIIGDDHLRLELKLHEVGMLPEAFQYGNH